MLFYKYTSHTVSLFSKPKKLQIAATHLSRELEIRINQKLNSLSLLFYCKTSFMGNCSSFESLHAETAKVVVHDGTMKEFSYAVKVSYLLQLYPGCFICDSDEIGFDDMVVAMHEDEVLILGQLYFALPLNRLKRPLPVREMAALAVKASSALNKCGAGEKVGYRRKRVVMFSGEGNGKSGRRVSPEHGCADGDVSVGRTRSGRRVNYGGGRGKFVSELSCIPE